MYLLDTDICIYLINRKFPDLNNRVYSCVFDSIAISSITLAELEYGAALSSYPERNRETLLLFAKYFDIIPFDHGDAAYFGLIRALLRRSGTPIGPYDLQIASQCLQRDMTLITNNIREFSRVPDLKLEDWLN
jgi:tRNA(fMet)-specific endonuclease VapC